MVKRQNIKQAIGIQVTSSQNISIKKSILLSKCDLANYASILLGWKFAFICHDFRTEKQNIYVKKRKNKRSN